jgi:hypothetical protein
MHDALTSMCLIEHIGLEIVDSGTKEGEERCVASGICHFPTIMIIDDKGSIKDTIYDAITMPTLRKRIRA